MVCCARGVSALEGRLESPPLCVPFARGRVREGAKPKLELDTD